MIALCTDCFFFFNDTATTEIYTLSLHDALPICSSPRRAAAVDRRMFCRHEGPCRRRMVATGSRTFVSTEHSPVDRKSTRLNSSHLVISYAVFCLKKKKQRTYTLPWQVVSSKKPI